MELAEGQVVADRYKVRRALGRGGMATAVLVEDRLLEIDLTLKLLGSTSLELLDAIRFEFATLQGLSHASLLRVHDFGVIPDESGGRRCFYTADFVDGVPLDEAALGASWEAVLRPLCDALGALHVLHGAGVRHGDVKPANIMVRRDGSGVLIDLGCAEAMRPPGSPPGPRPLVSGTPGFIAPEVLAGEPADGRADLYSLGKSLESLAGLMAEPPPDDVARLVSRLCRPRRDERPTGAAEVLQLLGTDVAMVHPVAGRLGRFVGRRDSLRAVRAAIDALLGGRATTRAIHFRGPEGVGRSRLLAEARWRAQMECRVLEVDPCVPDAVARLVSMTRREEMPRPTLDAVLRAAGRISGTEPVVWVIDDVHELDEAEQALLGAVLGQLGPGTPLLALVTSLPGSDLGFDGTTVFDLAPLGPGELGEWLGRTLSPTAFEQVARLSGGVPEAVLATLRPLVSGRATEEEIGAIAPILTASRRAAVTSLGADEQRALGLLAFVEETLRHVDIARFGLEPATLESLCDRGFAARDGAGWKLVGANDAIGEALDPALATRLHAEVADRSSELLAAAGREGGAASRIAAHQVLHLALAGRTDAAARALFEGAPLVTASPRSWQRAAEVLASRVDDPVVQVVTATLERLAGSPRPALDRVRHALEHGLGDEWEARARIELGACHSRLGERDRAIEELERARALAPSQDLRAQAANHLVRVLTGQGRHDEALGLAHGALAECDDPLTRADLLEAAGVAASSGGDQAQARVLLGEADGLLARTDDPRRRIRALGSRALAAYYQGDLISARDDHQRALELAEQRGIADQVATAALNLGTVSHQRGE
jgi:tetratricopeptide (TPR) repeat protein